MCGTNLYHILPSDCSLSVYNNSIKSKSACSTTPTHNLRVRGLWRRGATYQFRVRVPADLMPVMGCSHLNRSLRTDSRSLAIRLSRKAAFEIEALFESVRRGAGKMFDERLLSMGQDQSFPVVGIPECSPPSKSVGRLKPVVKSIKKLTEIYDLYLADPTKKRSKRTMLAHHTTRKVVEDVIGKDVPIADITRENCRELLDILRWLPVNFSKIYGDSPVRKVVELAKKDRKIQTINTTNINAYMSRFATMLNWAVTEEHITKNPAKGLQLADTVRDVRGERVGPEPDDLPKAIE